MTAYLFMLAVVAAGEAQALGDWLACIAFVIFALGWE